MNAVPEPQVDEKPEAPADSRLPRLVRWGVRATSVPVLGMLMISLVPALASFSISSRDDKMLALALCGIAIGFLIGWRWAAIGGALALAGVLVVLKQSDFSLFADPFSIAFALQAFLFLISWALNTPSHITGTSGFIWLKRGLAALLVLAALGGVMVLLRGPGPVQIPKGKEAFVGTWEDGAGFTLEITSEGRAKVAEEKTAKVLPCNTPVQPGETREFIASFRTDDILELSSGAIGPAKVYHVDRRPLSQKDRIRMVLNGSDPYVRTNAMVLVKRTVPSATTNQPAKVKL